MTYTYHSRKIPDHVMQNILWRPLYRKFWDDEMAMKKKPEEKKTKSAKWKVSYDELNVIFTAIEDINSNIDKLESVIDTYDKIYKDLSIITNDLKNEIHKKRWWQFWR